MSAYIPPKDRVIETSTSNSQTVFALDGAIDASYNAFSAHMSVGDWTEGAVVEPGVAFKSGKLTYSATNEITVDSTDGESKGTFSSGGTKEIMMGRPAKLSLSVYGAQSLTPGQKDQARSNINAPTLGYGGSGTAAFENAWNGSGGIGGGYREYFQKNAVTKWQHGFLSSVLGSGSSDDLTWYLQGVGYCMTLNAADASVSIGSSRANNGSWLNVSTDYSSSRAALDVIDTDTGSAAHSVVYFRRSTTSVVGSISITNTATSFNTSSDKTRKTDWKPYNDAAKVVMALEIWDFAWRDGGGRAVGVLAQDAYRVFPDAITPSEKEGEWQADYSKFVPVLISHNQLLQKMIDELAARIAFLERTSQ